MRPVRWIGLLAVCMLATTAVAAAREHYTGISLETPFPTQTLQLQKQLRIPLTVHNYGLAPQVVQLAVRELPHGWKAHLEGDNHVVGAAFVGTGKSRSLTLVVSPGAGAKPGHTYDLHLLARGRSNSAALPLALRFTHAPPAVLALATQLPKLKGSSSTTFTYHLTLKNESDKAVNANLTASAPHGFQVNFSPQFSSSNITSLPVKAGQSKKVDASVRIPPDAKARSYPIRVTAEAGRLSAATTLTAVITGSPKLSLTTPSGRLSGSANAGQSTPVHLVLKNTGSAPAHGVSLSADSPSHWQVTFHPAHLSAIPADGSTKVVADVHASGRSLAGDYMVTFDANAAGGTASTSANYRVTVATSTLWGIVGVVIVAVALAVVGFAVARFGRR